MHFHGTLGSSHVCVVNWLYVRAVGRYNVLRILQIMNMSSWSPWPMRSSSNDISSSTII